MLIEATAPAKIDLAGGPLDIDRLHLLLCEAVVTVHTAIALPARVTLTIPDDDTARGDDPVVIIARHRRKELRGPSLDEALGSGRELPRICRILRYFAPPPPFLLEIQSDVPAGSGLGGTSAVSIALCATLSLAASSVEQPLPAGTPSISEEKRSELVTVARDLEMSALRAPTGSQGFHAAAFGGTAAIHHRVGTSAREVIPLDPRHLEEKLILSHFGKLRYAGINSWQVYRSVVDGKIRIRNTLLKINQAASRMRQALIEGDLDEAGKIASEEWKLKSRIEPPADAAGIQHIFGVSRKAGAAGGTVFGTGGSTILAIIARQGRRSAVERALRNEGARILPSPPNRDGLRIRMDMTHQPGLLPITSKGRGGER